VIDKCGILGVFAIEFRRFWKLGFFMLWSRCGFMRCQSSFLQLPYEFPKLGDLLLEFCIADH